MAPVNKQFGCVEREREREREGEKGCFISLLKLNLN